MHRKDQNGQSSDVSRSGDRGHTGGEDPSERKTAANLPQEMHAADDADSETPLHEGSLQPKSPNFPPPHSEQTVISQKPQLASTEFPGAGSDLDSIRLNAGDRLGHYELVNFVGGGGMGRVFRALDTKLDRHVAIKVLPGEQMADKETLQRFHNEAKSAARLDHDNIARVYDVGEDRGLCYLVFEFVEGMTIRDMVERDGPMSLADALRYTLQAANALTHAAGRGVVHRDVKPSNIIITADGRAKLIDMGLARIQMPRKENDDLTATGVTLGTFDYISPEQARDPRIVDVRSDIYSLGCTFFYMLTAQPPFPEGTVLQKLLQHQGDEPPNIQEFRPEMPAALVDVFGKLLAKEPKRRYQTPQELIEHLLFFAAQVGLQPMPMGNSTWTLPRQPRSRLLYRHLPWMAPVVSLLVIWLCVHLYWSYWPQSSDHVPAVNVQPTSTIASEQIDTGTIPTLSANSGSLEALPQSSSDERLASGEKSATVVDLLADTPSPLPLANSFDSQALDLDKTRGTSLGDIPITNFNKEAAASQTPSSAAERPRAFQQSLTAAHTLPSLSLLPEMESEVAAQDRSPLPSATSMSGVRIVDALGGLPGTYATLRAACNDARSGDIIELRYNGRCEENPLSLGNIDLTIRAGKKFRPVVVFHPNQSDPSKCPRDMFGLTGTRLTLLNLQVELRVPRAVPADEWSLFALGRSDAVRLQKCALTIRNALETPRAEHEQVAFFRVHAEATDATLIENPLENGPIKTAKIELVNCVARGEAVFLRSEELQPLRMTWKNGLLITSEQMLEINGGQQSPPADDKIDVELQHLTAVVNGGLCRTVSGGFIYYQLPIALKCTDSIILSVMNSPLIEQIDGRGTSEMQKLFTYVGDRNCYQGFNVFWSIDDNDPISDPQRIEWDDWQMLWAPNEKNSLWCRVDWQRLPEASRLPHTLTPWDYALSESEENPARYAASDGSDVGCDPARLPALSPEAHGARSDFTAP